MLARSLLFVPGNQERMLAKAAGLPADAFILDLEDSVPPAARADARALVAEHAPRLGEGRAWVRVNALASGGEEDLPATVGVPGVAGLVIPKVDSAEEMARWDALIAAREDAAGLARGATPVLLNVESARGVLHLFAVATASARVRAACFGGARDGDLMTDLGCAWSIDGPEMLHARQQTLLGVRAAGLVPLDGVFADVRDADGFARETELSRRLGFRGRQVVHPAQIEPANRLYAPSAREVEYYGRVLETFEAALARGSASTTLDGRLVDEAMAKAARRVLALAERSRT